MRLIDADKFIKKFRYAEADTEDEKAMCSSVRRLIKEEPTAYDVENVVEELEKLEYFADKNVCSKKEIIFMAIKIVKEGVKND